MELALMEPFIKSFKGPGEAYMKENVQGMDIDLKIALGES
jgi:hypothetical protein